MTEHFGRFLLAAKLNQGRNCVKRVEEKMRLQLHLESPQLRLGKLLLQRQRFHCIPLRAHLKLDNADHPQNESVDKNLNAEAIDVQQACPNCERRRMCGIDEAETAQQEQMNDSKKAPDDHLDDDRHRRKAKNDRLAKACRPNRARDATPPGPQHESLPQT